MKIPPILGVQNWGYISPAAGVFFALASGGASGIIEAKTFEGL